MHTHTHTLLLSNAQNADINTVLSASEIHSTCEGAQTRARHLLLLLPVGQFLGRQRQTGRRSLSSQLCPTRSAATGTHQPQSHLHLIRGGLPHPYPEQAEPCNGRGNPWSSDTSRSLHVEAECDVGCCLVMEGLRTEASKDPQTALPQWGLVAYQAPYGVPRRTNQPPHKDPAADGHV